MPTVSQIFGMLGDGWVSSKFDAISGFHHVKLCEECHDGVGHLHHSVWPVLLLPVAIWHHISSGALSEVYVRHSMQTPGSSLHGGQRPGIQCIDAFAAELALTGAMLNASKCTANQMTASYLGVISAKGISLDPKKVKAVRNIPPQKDIKVAQRQHSSTEQGTVNHIGRFTLNLFSITELISAPLKKVAAQNWVEAQEAALCVIRDMPRSVCLTFDDSISRCKLTQSGDATVAKAAFEFNPC